MMTAEMIDSKIAEMKNLEEAIKLLQAQVDGIKEELKAELDSRQVDSVSTDLHNVFYSMYEKASVDTAKLKKDGLYNLYSKKSVVVQFKVTDKKAS